MSGAGRLALGLAEARRITEGLDEPFRAERVVVLAGGGKAVFESPARVARSY